jgi:3-hydroxybutyryl-CoA dehydrogenase
MHFFNPAPVLPLVEIIHAARSSSETIQALVRLAERLGKTPVVAGDTPGFIVNRVARPFYGEALRLLGEGAASHEQIDRLARLGGGFRMGPFELMDLIGIDVNYAATQSVFEQTFFEPRFRPHPIQAQMVAQKAFGRKSGRGFYTYPEGQPSAAGAPEFIIERRSRGPVLLAGGSWAPGLRNLLQEAGVAVLDPAAAEGQNPTACAIPGGRREGLEGLLRSLDHALPPSVPILCQCADVTVAELASWMRHPERMVGFDGLFLQGGPLTSLVASHDLQDTVRAAVEDLLAGLRRSPLWIADTPGLVLPRIVCTLANEAAFAAGEGVADPETIDRAMQLGTNYPKGPLAWARELGYGKVVSVLEHLRAEYGEERYRVAPLLRKWARLDSITKE